MFRVSNFAQHTLMLNNILNSQKRVFDGQIQAATGKVSQTYSGIAQETKRLLDLEGNLLQTRQYVKSNTIAISRLERMDSALTGMFDEASRVRALLIQKLSDSTGDAGALSTEAGHILDSVAGLLNTNEDGRFLFAGTITNVSTVVVPIPDPTTFGVLDTTYYRGDSVELSTRAADGLTVDTGMTGFRRLIGGLKGAIGGDITGSTTLLDQSLSLINQAITDLSDFRNEVGSRLSALSEANVRHQDFELYLENQISDIENADITQVMTRLSSDQLVLEASFMTVARLSSLNLAQFLR